MIFVNPLNSVFVIQNSEAENLVLIEMLDANEDGEVDSFEWTTMLSQVRLRVHLIIIINYYSFVERSSTECRKRGSKVTRQLLWFWFSEALEPIGP